MVFVSVKYRFYSPRDHDKKWLMYHKAEFSKIEFNLILGLVWF